MASQITSSSQTVSLLSTSQSASSSRIRDAAQSGFSDLLRGQMDSKNAASKQEPTSASSSQSEQRPERAEAKTSSSEGKQRTESAQKADAAEPKDETASSTAEDSSKTTEAPSDSTADASADTQKVAADEDAPASPATGVAGLPAEIAALLPAAALKQGSGNAKLADTTAEVSIDAELATNISLTGDTKGKPLQNPVDPQAALRSDAAQPDQAGKTALPFQLKPEMQTAFAERAATAMQPVAADLPDGTQTTFMHALRQPGHLASTTPQLQVATPAGQSAWAEDVGNRVMWMVGRAESKAELVLTPPSLGKVEVSINLNGDQTTAQFVAATQAARDALEQAMPRLREILAQSGISLGQANVSTSGEQQTSGEGHSQRSGRGSGDGGLDAGAGATAPQWTKQTVGLVDTFA